MAEVSLFWTTNGTGDGSGSGYTATQMFEVFRSLFTGGQSTNKGGVAADFGGKLAVTGTSSPVAVADGFALVYGIPYSNSASVNVTVPTPASATRIDRIVLRASYSAQTVRITRIAGVEGAGSAPAMTQSAGVTWDVPLATVSITTGGVITVTDAREWLRVVGDSGVSTAKIADSAITTAKVADSAITSAKIADGTIVAGDIASDAVTTAKILDANVTTAKIADSNVTTAKIADSAVSTAKVADDAVTNAKMANMAQATFKGRASGAGTGDPTDLTAAQAIAIIATADGTGSGLDADTLDGYHASDLATASHTHGTSGITDGAITTAKIATDAVDNARLANMAQATVKGRASSAGTGDPVDLTATEVRDIICTVDGSGSGLDADFLDGMQAAAFATAAHVHTTAWQNLTLSGGCSAGAYGTPQYRKNGDIVEFRGWVQFASGTFGSVSTLPVGHTPATDPVKQCCIDTTYYWVSGGILYLYNYAAGTQYDLSALRFCITA